MEQAHAYNAKNSVNIVDIMHLDKTHLILFPSYHVFHVKKAFH